MALFKLIIISILVGKSRENKFQKKLSTGKTYSSFVNFKKVLEYFSGLIK